MGRGFLGWDAFRPDGGSVFQVLPLVHGVPWGPAPPPCHPDGGAETQRAGRAGTLRSRQAQEQVTSTSPCAPSQLSFFFFSFFTAWHKL